MTKFILSAFADEAADSISDQISALKRNNIALLEIRSVDKKNVIDLDDNEVDQVRRALSESEIALSAIGSPIGKVDIDCDFEQYLEKFRRTLKIAHALGTNKIRIFSFFIPKDKRPEQYRETVLRYMQIMRDIAKVEGIILCHENEADIYGELPEQCLTLHKAIPELKAIFDPSNYVMADADIPWAIENITPFVEYLHIKDAISASRSIVPAGEGDGYILQLLREAEIIRRDMDTILTIEPHLHIFDAYASIDKRPMKHKFEYETKGEAFDAAVSALKGLLTKIGYREGEKGEWIK